METIDIIATSFIYGTIACSIGIMILLLCWGMQWMWAFTDDTKPKRNILIEYYMLKVAKYEINTVSQSNYTYRKRINPNVIDAKDLVSNGYMFDPLMIIYWTTVVLYLGYHCYIVILIPAIITAMLYLTRTVRRLNKLLKQHISNTNIHNEEQ